MHILILAYVICFFPVEIYNCATGSADCSQCLGREDLGHQCIWSEITSSCRLNTEFFQIPAMCPPPEIRKVKFGFTAVFTVFQHLRL